MLTFWEASRSFEPRHVSVAVNFPHPSRYPLPHSGQCPGVTSRCYGTVREISKVTRNNRRLRHIHVKNKSVGLHKFEHSSTWQAYMALPVCCKEVGIESLVSEVAKWNKFNFECYSLLTSTKIDSRTAVLWTRTYRVAMWQLSILWHSSANSMEVVSCWLWTWSLQRVDNDSTRVS
jgi:hypothetical protein